MIFERLNGWQRIWVVTSVLSLAVAVGLSALVWQTVEQCIYAKEENLAKNPGGGSLFSDDPIVSADNKKTRRLFDDVSEPVAGQSVGEADCRESVKVQRIQVVLLLTYWLAFIGVTYLFGWAIGWIARGFTRK